MNIGPFEKSRWNLNQNATSFAHCNELENIACVFSVCWVECNARFSLMRGNSHSKEVYFNQDYLVTLENFVICPQTSICNIRQGNCVYYDIVLQQGLLISVPIPCSKTILAMPCFVKHAISGFYKIMFSLTKKLTNGALVTPTPGLRKKKSASVPRECVPLTKKNAVHTFYFILHISVTKPNPACRQTIH